MVFTNMQMVVNLVEIGKITKYMVKANKYILMVEFMKVITIKIKNKVMVFSYGQMVENMKDHGLMANNQVQQYIIIQEKK